MDSNSMKSFVLESNIVPSKLRDQQEFPLFRSECKPNKEDIFLSLPEKYRNLILRSGLEKNLLLGFLANKEFCYTDMMVACMISVTTSTICLGYKYVGLKNPRQKKNINSFPDNATPSQIAECAKLDALILEGDQVELEETKFPNPYSYYKILDHCFNKIVPAKLRIIQDQIPINGKACRCFICHLKFPKQVLHVLAYLIDCKRWRRYFLNHSFGVYEPSGRILCQICCHKMTLLSDTERFAALNIMIPYSGRNYDEMSFLLECPFPIPYSDVNPNPYLPENELVTRVTELMQEEMQRGGYIFYPEKSESIEHSEITEDMKVVVDSFLN